MGPRPTDIGGALPSVTFRLARFRHADVQLTMVEEFGVEDHGSFDDRVGTLPRRGPEPSFGTGGTDRVGASDKGRPRWLARQAGRCLPGNSRHRPGPQPKRYDSSSNCCRAWPSRRMALPIRTRSFCKSILIRAPIWRYRPRPEAKSTRSIDLSLIFSKELGDAPEPYERLLGDALRGDASLFTREDSIEGTWRISPRLLIPLPSKRVTGFLGPGQRRHTPVRPSSLAGSMDAIARSRVTGADTPCKLFVRRPTERRQGPRLCPPPRGGGAPAQWVQKVKILRMSEEELAKRASPMAKPRRRSPP